MELKYFLEAFIRHRLGRLEFLAHVLKESMWALLPWLPRPSVRLCSAGRAPSPPHRSRPSSGCAWSCPAAHAKTLHLSHAAFSNIHNITPPHKTCYTQQQLNCHMQMNGRHTNSLQSNLQVKVHSSERLLYTVFLMVFKFDYGNRLPTTD